MKNLNTPVKIGREGYAIQDIDFLSICKKYETPFFLYDLDHVIARYKSLVSSIAWPKLKIFYAMKANYNLELLKALKAENACIDTVSPAEVFLALKAGFPKENLLYTANNLTEDEIQLVKKQGVLFNIDSLSCLEKFGAAFPGSDVCLRFNSDVVAGENEKIQTGGDKTKFGIRLDDLQKARAIVDRCRLNVVGLHEHTGSGIAEAEKFYQGMKNLLGIASPKAFPNLRFVDFGGGFKVPYHPEEKRIDYEQFGKGVTALFADFCAKYGRELFLYFEPGKYMVAEAGILVTKVSTLINNKGRLIAGTDSGFPHLIRPILYDAYHHILNISNPEGKQKKHDVCGNICESGDLFASDRDVPEIREGDYLAVLNAGAYCFSMASIYNLRPLPGEVILRNGKTFLSRVRTTPKEMADEVYAAYR